jgi:glutamate--cysteine ligase
MTQLDASARANAEPISGKDELTAYLETGNKPKSDWRIGTEHEKFVFCRKSLEPVGYDGERSIRAILQALSDQFGWEGMYEGDNLVALKKDGASVTLEPGGQMELSGAPLEHIHQTCNEVHTHLDQVKQVVDPVEVGFIGFGHTPNWTRAQMPHMPKGRYKIMRNYMPKVGSLGLDMMHRTATVQVNLDFASEADMVKKFRTSLALQPLATALFANSALREGEANGYCSWRAHIWTDTDPDRTGMLDFVFEDGFGFERYTDYMLDVPMYFLWRDGDYTDAAGLSFRDFMAGKLPVAEGLFPTIEDWKDHLSTAFPEVRLKTFLEMRGADSGPWGRICALPAFWVGLLYDDPCLEAAWDVARKWTPEMRGQLRLDAAQYGLKAKIGKFTLQDIAKEVLAISREGLKKRKQLDTSGSDESGFLSPLQEMADSGVTLGEQMRDEYLGEMNRDMHALYEKYAF